MAGNPVKGRETPRVVDAEGKTPAIGDRQTGALLAAPDADTLRRKHYRAISLLYHGQLRAELCA